MIKRIKEFLELIVSFGKAWPYLLLALGYLLSIYAFAVKFSSTIVQFSVPRFLLITVITLALYPIAKLIEVLIKSKKQRPFLYKGLLWEPTFLDFGYPTPTCPHEDCGRKIFLKTVPSISVQPISGAFLQASPDYNYIYKCPIHGVLDVPNLSIRELQEKAKLARK